MNNLKKLRKAHGLNQVELAKLLNISQASLSFWENGVYDIDNESLIKLSDIFNTTTDEILGNTDTKKAPAGVYPVEDYADLVVMPVLASVKAGYDGQAVLEYSTEMYTFPRLFFKGYPQEECAVLRVVGNSMYPRYLEGDLVFVHMQPSVDSGSFAVVIYNGDEATIKKVHYVPGEDWLELVPTNPEYQTKRIEGIDLEQCHIFGKVIGVYRDE